MDIFGSLESYFLKSYSRDDFLRHWRAKMALYASILIPFASAAALIVVGRNLSGTGIAIGTIPATFFIVLMLLRRGAPIALVSDILFGCLCLFLCALILGGATPYVSIWFMVLPLFEVLLRGSRGGFVWSIVNASILLFFLLVLWAGPEGMLSMPDIFKHIYPSSVPVAILVLFMFFGVGLFTIRAIDNAMLELSAKNESLIREIDRRMKAEEELKSAVAHRERLLSVISHDLVNLVSGLSGFFNSIVVEEDWSALGPVEIKEVRKSLDRLNRMLENLLYWSRIETGKIKPAIERIDPGKYVLEEIEGLRRSAEEKKISIVYSVNGEGKISIDGSLLRIVARNLIQNAVKYSSTESKVTVMISRKFGSLVLSVADAGPGIQPDVASIILGGDFVESTRGSAGERGHGIGLALCLDILRLYGGGLEISLSPEGGAIVSAYFGKIG